MIEPLVRDVLFGLAIYGMAVFFAAGVYQFRRKKKRSAWTLLAFSAAFGIIVAIGVYRRANGLNDLNPPASSALSPRPFFPSAGRRLSSL